MIILKELITKKIYDNMDDYTNSLTEEMDKYIIGKYPKYFKTYIYGNKPINSYYVLRFPGATRGYIEVNKDNVIEDVVLYDDIPSCYKEEVKQAIKKFYGYKIIFE